MDGVMQANGPSIEDRKKGFTRDGWAIGTFDDEALARVGEIYQRADAFLFGRRTYDLFAPYWGAITDPANPIATAMNSAPKYVASATLTDPSWPGTTVLGGDLAAALADLKATPGGELQVHGSGALTRWLLANDLLDELTLIVCPVIVGAGERLFPAEGPDAALELLDSRTTPNGLTFQVYRPAGRPTYTHAVA